MGAETFRCQVRTPKYIQVFLKWVLLAVFAAEGPKKGVGLINGLLLVGQQSGAGGGGAEYMNDPPEGGVNDARAYA